MNTKNEKVAVFIQSLKGGGAERSTVNLVNALAREGISVDLLVADIEGVFTGQVSKRVNLVKIEKIGFWKAVFSISIRNLFYLFLLFLTPGSPKPLRAIPAIADYLKQSKPSVLMSVLAYGNVASVVAADRVGLTTRVVIGQRNYLSKEYERRAGWRRTLVKPALGYFYRKASVIVSVAKAAATDLCETLAIPEDRVVTIYNAVANAELHEQSREAMDHPWFNHKDRPVILAAGKLKPQKDFVTLLHAFQNVRREMDARLVILGDGPELGKLKQLAADLNVQDDVSFEGFVVNPFKFMRNADLFVLSSAFEGLPGVLIQALACGCPVVSTDCPSGPHEILEAGDYGDLVEVGNPDALATAIIHNLTVSHDRDRLRRRGADFSEGAAVSNYRNVLFDSPKNQYTPHLQPVSAE